MRNKLFWVDTETTGIDPTKDSIVELYAILDKSEEEIELQCRPVPESRITKEALAINRKTVEEIQQYPPAEDSVQYLIHKLIPVVNNSGKLIISGWNAFFDYQFLRQMFAREFCKPVFDEIFSYHVLDVSSIALMCLNQEWIKIYREISLSVFTEYLGIDHEPHSAKSDCLAAKIIYDYFCVILTNSKTILFDRR